jgi:nucleotide-binding universal stress UspA family protein
MRIKIRDRTGEVPLSVQSYARRKLRLIGRHFDLLTEAEVEFNEEDADRTVANIVRSLRKAGIKVATHSPVAPAGIPFAIEREARTWNADLIVIGSRRLSDLASVFLGALDHQVIHLSEQPVLIAQRPDLLVGSAAAPG